MTWTAPQVRDYVLQEVRAWHAAGVEWVPISLLVTTLEVLNCTPRQGKNDLTTLVRERRLERRPSATVRNRFGGPAMEYRAVAAG